MPAEHGGWGLTLEPGVLGVLLAPSVAALALGAGALLAFLLRTPLRLALIGRHRAGTRPGSTLGRERLRLATRVAGLEVAALVLVLAAAAVLAVDPLWWLPGLAAAPLFVIALWFDMHSLSRHVVPEIVGSVAIASVAAMGALAGGAERSLAIGAWVILGARILSSIPHVRAQVLRIHERPAAAMPSLVGDVAALAAAAVAVWLDGTLFGGAIAIVTLVVVQRVTLARPPRPAKILGLRQMILGFGVVGATAIGAWLL
jgi:hypothetical protein